MERRVRVSVVPHKSTGDKKEKYEYKLIEKEHSITL